LKPIKICRFNLGLLNPPEKAKTRHLNKLNVFNKILSIQANKFLLDTKSCPDSFNESDKVAERWLYLWYQTKERLSLELLFSERTVRALNLG